MGHQKSFLDYKTFFEKEQLCKGLFQAQASHLEDTSASFSFHLNTYLIVESLHVYTPKIKIFQ